MSNYTIEEAEKINAYLATVAKAVRHALDTQQYARAKQILLEKALPVVPDHQVVLSDLAYCEKMLGNLEQGYAYLEQARAQHPNLSPEVCDMFVMICCAMKRFEEARYYARLALQRKKTQLAEQAVNAYPLPTTNAPGLNPDKRKNIICFSLFGSQPRYCETAVINVNLAHIIYPEWTCRFYLDDSVPDNVVQRLQQNGAEVIKVTPEQQEISGLFWRFFIFDDPNVHCFIIRDADSLLSFKEKAAVDEWLKSGKWFHLMRDALEHSELILAGMWGGYGGILNRLETLSADFYRNLPILNKTIDQHFLRTLYPTVAQSVLVHDNHLIDPEANIFPPYTLSDIEKIPYFHIGMVDAGIETLHLHLNAESPTETIRWQLNNEQNEPICAYISAVEELNGSAVVKLNLPYFYVQKINQGLWHFSYENLT